MYETITINALNNRAPNVRTAGDCDIIDTPARFFSCQSWQEDRQVFWNSFETLDQEEAEAQLAQWEKMGSTKPMRIVIVECEPGLRHLNGTLHVVPQAPLERAIDQVVAPQPAQEPSDASLVAQPSTTTMSFNKEAHRYEARIGDRLFYVEESVFAERFLAASCCRRGLDEASPDDEYHVWGSLTRLTSWDFSGKHLGVGSSQEDCA